MNFDKINADIRITKLENEVGKVTLAIHEAIEARRVKPVDLWQYTINTTVKKRDTLSFITDQGRWLVIENNDDDDRNDDDSNCLRYPRLSMKLALKHGVIPVNLAHDLTSAKAKLTEATASETKADNILKAQQKLLDAVGVLGVTAVKQLLEEV
jgi:hypothetical protein